MRLLDLPIPLIVAAWDTSTDGALIAIGGHPPVRLPAASARDLLLAWDPVWRVSWGFADVPGDMRRPGDPCTLARATGWLHIDADPTGKTAIRALIWYAQARRAAAADDAFAASGFRLVDEATGRPDLPEIGDPHADARTTTVDGAAAHASDTAARRDPPRSDR